MARDEEAFTSASSAVNSWAERRQLLWDSGEKTDHFSHTNEFTVQSVTFSSPAPSSSPKEIIKVIKYLDVFHMYVSTSYKVEVDQLGELKIIRKDWKRERLQGKQLFYKRNKQKQPFPTKPNQKKTKTPKAHPQTKLIQGQVAFSNILQASIS